MPSKKPLSVKKPIELAPQARHIMRRAIKTSLATNDRKKDWPFLSLTSVATLMDGTPILLLSNIAHHSRNIAVDPNVSLLLDNTPSQGSPLEQGRITLFGTLKKNTSSVVEERFMARHPEAFYAQFSDFDFYTLDLKTAHYVAGFGSTTTLSPAHLQLDPIDESLSDFEPDILQQANQDHHDIIQKMGQQSFISQRFISQQGKDTLIKPENWIMTALDPEGCDLMAGTTNRARFEFSSSAYNASTIEERLLKIAHCLEDQT